MANSLFELNAPLNVIADSPPMPGGIHEKMYKLRLGLGGLMAVSGGQAPFPTKSAKQLMKKFRRGMDRLRMSCYPIGASMGTLPKEKGVVVSGILTFRYMCLDDLSYQDIVAMTMGADNQDKAAGKAFTYGWKFAAMYALLLPDEEVKEEWDNVPDSDDDFEPTGEPSGMANTKVKDIMTRFAACTSLEQWQALGVEVNQAGLGAALQPYYPTLNKLKEKLINEGQVVSRTEET